jgi:PAS domain S-box-containing protein
MHQTTATKETQNRPQQPILEPMSQETIQVLHVDDEPGFAELTETFLKRETDRFTVETATSADKGFDIITDCPPDCVVSDYNMPGMDGIKFLRAVRDEYPNLPFILFTGRGSEEVASDAISAGATDYLQKKSGNDQYRLLANRILNSVEQYRSEQKLRETQAEYAVVFENAQNALLFVNVENGEFRYQQCNPQAVELLGRDKAEIVGKSPREVFGSENGRKIAGAYRKCVEQRESVELTVTLDLPVDRVIREYQVAPLQSDSGIKHLVVSCQDITQRRERQQELKEYETITGALTDAIYMLDETGRFTYVNEEFVELVGYDRETILGNTPSLIKADDAIERAEQQLGRLLSSDGPESVKFEVTIQPRDDDPIVCEDHMGVLPYEGDSFDGSVGTLRDISDHKERKRELKARTAELEDLTTELEEQYQYLFEEAPVMAVVTRAEDGKPVIEDCNQLFVETLEYEKSNVIGEELASFYTPESQQKLLDEGGYERALAGEFVRENRELVTAEGLTVETLLRAVPRQEAREDASGAISLYIDISERKQLERENSRLEEFSRVVSHDLRNPLRVASGRLELAREECDSEHFDAIESALERMNRIIDDLLWLAQEGQDIGSVEPVDIQETVTAAWCLVADNKEQAELRCADGELDADTIIADSDRLRQLLENLFRNAIKHGGEEVTITIGTENERFYVEDDGPGISPDERDDVFDAGYTTANDGTGLGLSIVQRIVAAHDWEVCVTEGSAGGARFVITGVEFV